MVHSLVASASSCVEIPLRRPHSHQHLLFYSRPDSRFLSYASSTEDFKLRATLPTAALESARFDAARGALSADAPSYVVVGLDSGKYVLLSHVPPTSQVQNRGARVGKGEYKNLKQNNLAEKNN